MLSFELYNFRAVASAVLELPGITVLAGKNGSGKSSISKVLYCILDTATRFETFVARGMEKKSSRLFSSTVDLVLNLAFQFPRLSDSARHHLFPTSETINPQAWVLGVKRLFLNNRETFASNQNVVSLFLSRARSALENQIECREWKDPIDFLDNVKGAFDKFDVEKSEKTYARPLDVLADRLFVFLEESLDLQSTNVVIDGDPLIKFATKRLDSPVNVKRVFYIDTPWVSDLCDVRGGLSYGRDVRLEYREHLAKTIRSSKEGFEVPLRDVMQSVVHGAAESIKTDSGYRLVFNSKEFNSIFSLFHCATGVKAFSLLQLLLICGKLDAETLLILDEPESNLHPEWVVEYARAVVMLHRLLGVRFLISTHSTDFVAGIQAIAKKEKVDENVRFYLAEKQDEVHYTFNGKGFDIGEIFDSFNRSLDRVADYGEEV